VRAVPEADMSDAGARHVERIGVDVLTLVASGRPGQQRDLGSRGNYGVVIAGVAQRLSAVNR
jgi:hypothetical protein